MILFDKIKNQYFILKTHLNSLDLRTCSIFAAICFSNQSKIHMQPRDLQNTYLL